MASKNPMTRVYEMLDERDDIYIAVADTDRVVGFQLRRQWAVTTRNPAGFNPVTTEHWHYYSQYFEVRVKHLTKKQELTPELGALAAEMGHKGGWLILIDEKTPLDAVIDRLSAVPENFKEYLARLQK